MTDAELDQLEKTARRPNRGASYFLPSVVIILIEEIRRLQQRAEQGELFEHHETKTDSKHSD